MTTTVEITDDTPGGSRGGAIGSAPTGFDPLSRQTLSAQIRDQLLQRIKSGELEPGARVPSERALSDQFQVARTSVREAMQGLLSMGVIERRGNRSYVAEKLPDVHLDLIDDRKEFVRQLFETRRALEMPIMQLAADRATEEQRAEIARLAAEFRVGMPLMKFRELDRAFHSAIARSCGNPLLLEVYGKVLARLFRSTAIDSLLSDDANRHEVERIVAESTEHHATIAAAFAAADGTGVVDAGGDHLSAVEHRMIDRLK